MVKSRDYWRKRFEILEEAQFQKSESYYKDIEKAYKQTMIEIEKDIARWYQRFADNNEISLAEAKRLLKSDELKELRWTVEEYIKYGKENAINRQWMKQLENASSRVHISRLESLQLQLQQHVEKLYGGQIEGFERLMKEVYHDQYYQTAFTMQSAFEAGFAFQTLNDDILTKVISKPWTADGLTFSTRIWRDKNLLINTLQKELVQSFARGESPQRAISVVQKRLDVSRSNAARLVQTEASFFGASAQRDAFKALSVEQYEIVATLDNRTSPICRSMDGKVFLMADFEPGVTANPFHARCRTTTAPYFADDVNSERFARNADGSVEYIDARIKYDEWKKRYVDVTGEVNQAKKRPNKIMITDQAIEKVQFVEIPDFTDEQNSKLQERHKQLLREAKEKNKSNEVLDIITLDFLRSAMTFGDENKVAPSNNPNAVSLVMSKPHNSLIYIHNHPKLGTFSVADLHTFLTVGQINTLTVVTNQGNVFALTKTQSYNERKVYDLVVQIAKSLGIDLQKPLTDEEDKLLMKEFLKQAKGVGIKYGK